MCLLLVFIVPHVKGLQMQISQKLMGALLTRERQRKGSTEGRRELKTTKDEQEESENGNGNQTVKVHVVKVKAQKKERKNERTKEERKKAS